MESHQPLDKNLSDQLELNGRAINYLREAAKWGKFIGIIGFVMIGIFVVFAVFMGAIFGGTAAMSNMSYGMGAMSGGMITGTYLVMALIYFFPTLYLYRFSVRTARALRDSNSELLTDGVGQLKSMFKFMGILMIVIIGLYAIIFIFAAIIGAAGLAM
jgi:hypothetical protein